MESRLVPMQSIDIHLITVSGLRGASLLSRLFSLLQLIRACVQSLRLLHALKPRAVLGMGGFVSGPVGIAAVLLRKPLVLHEQNAIAGLTNRYLSAVATRVYCAWPEAFKASRKFWVVGNPVNADMETLAQRDRVVNTDKSMPLKLLIAGGSRGARTLNELVPEAIALLDRPLEVVHQAGQIDVDVVVERYENAVKAVVEVTDFIDDMAAAYCAADLVISRSGAMTVTELSALRVPSILVPFPHAVDDHQTRNARFLSDHGAALLLPQSELNAQTLATLLTRLIDDRHELQRMSDAAGKCFSAHAAQTLAEGLLEVSH
jgi:UDP-N-acetylglucosamine--N-acetylmuramyl-(pentapeptide) pyrophosphoryl-undecaprenol N-acetylglucosamine transferase